MNILVTGGAGFIGSHLVEKLLHEKNIVTAYDNLSSGKKANLKNCIEHKKFCFVEDDLLNAESLNRAMAGIEVVWHLAANTDIRKGNHTVDLDLKNCTVATFNVLEAMRKNNVKQILFSSSCTVYGDASSVAISENYGPLMPISLYGAGKLGAEAFITSFSHLYGIKAIIFRFANIIGPRMGHGVIFDFINKLKTNPNELEILGNGAQEKPYVLVEDCIEGMLTAYQNFEDRCDIYNLGCDSYTRVTRLAEIVIEEMGLKNVLFKYTGGKQGFPGDIPVVHYDISKLKKMGWKAMHSSDEAVRMATQKLLTSLN